MQKLITKTIQKQLHKNFQHQYTREYGDLDMSQLVPLKLFVANWTWYIMTQDPNNPDYLWAIVDGFEVEMGSVSLS